MLQLLQILRKHGSSVSRAKPQAQSTLPKHGRYCFCPRAKASAPACLPQHSLPGEHMRYVKNHQEELELFSALGSEVRISILNLLLKNGRMSMNDIASHLKLTGGAITPHVKKLEQCELIRISADVSEHGNKKICEPCLDKILLVISRKHHTENVYRAHLRVGQYATCEEAL